MNDKIIISICGAAGTGKSILAKRLAESLGKNLACRIPTDYYLKSYSGEQFEEYINSPFKYDWNLLKQVLKLRIGANAETPDFDFVKLIRNDKTGGIHFIMNRYVLLDGILPYPDSKYVIKLDAPADLRLKRIKERDKKNKTNSARNWLKMEATAKELESGDYKFDLELNGEDEIEVNVGKIVGYLKENRL